MLLAKRKVATIFIGSQQQGHRNRGRAIRGHTTPRLITWQSGSSGREALVAMVQTTDLSNGDYPP
jgi:hypothetical protein